MIRSGQGSLLDADADALVNTVNTVGVMGKGIALQFKHAFPDNFKAYRKACERGDVVPGRMFVFETGRLRPRLIINFPTKRHWRSPSRLEDIESGLMDLVDVIRRHAITSIAVPPLGAGNGGLDWSKVRPLIVAALEPIASLEVQLFEPGGAPPPQAMPVAPAKVRMTDARAAMLALFERYLQRAFTLGRLEAQKLVYFLQAAGQVFPRLVFTKGRFGPYAEVLNHVLSTIDGHFIRGYGDRTQHSDIIVLPDAYVAAEAVLDEHPGARYRIERVLELIDGYEGLYGMELLATVHWVATHDLASAASPDAAVAQVQAWNNRKRERFAKRHVEEAWRRLGDKGWLPSTQHTLTEATVQT